MNVKRVVSQIFPQENNIPKKFRLPGPVEQSEYLSNGEIHHWQGPMQEVRSPVCLSSAAGPSPKIIGKYPLLTEKEALETLDAAVRAYDYGRGA